MYLIEIFEASVVRLCQLNELTSLLSPWILFIPTTRLAGKIHPAVFALIYAIAEQSLTFGSHFLAWHPLIVISQVTLLEPFTGLLLFPLERQRSMSPARDIAIQTSTLSNGKQENSLNSESLLPSKDTAIWTSNLTAGGQRDELEAALWDFLWGFLPTAWSNGALVLYAQMLQGSSRLQQSPNGRMVDLSRILLLLLYRLLTFFRWRRSVQTSGFLRKWQNLFVPLYSQAIFLGVRALFRWGCGFSVLLGLKMLGEGEADEAFGLGRYGRKGNVSPIFGQISWGLGILTLLMWGLREWVHHREANRA